MGNAPISAEERHPVLLPYDHHVTEIIASEVHRKQAGHSGREHTLACLRRNYWIIKGRRLMYKITTHCVVCRRNNFTPKDQRQAELPEDRVTPGNPPFCYTGTDCFGPFIVKQGRKQFKRWGCLFTCLTTRAVHLEVLTSLDADAFINAIVRFSSRRGTPERMRSDNGTNMVAANKELKVAMQTWTHDKKVQHTMLEKQIDWRFNPPTASHMGGVWERQIRTVRKVLRAIVGSQVLDDERLHTLFCEVEDVVNQRPLTPVSEDIDDLEALTPNHLLRPGTTRGLPLGGLLLEEPYRKRWKHVQFLADQFWKRWLREYLPLIRSRQKGFRSRRNFQPNDMVIVSGEGTHRHQWPLGRIVEAMPDKDGLVRRAKVKTARGMILRPVNRLCHLEGVSCNANPSHVGL